MQSSPADAAAAQGPWPVELLLESAARRWPDRQALDFYDHAFSFGELHRLAARAAKGFQELGVGPGVHVGLHLPNTPHYMICLFGVWMAGGAVVNLNPLAPQAVLQHQCIDADIRVLVTFGSAQFYPLAASLKGAGVLETLVVCTLDDFPPAPRMPSYATIPVAPALGSVHEIGFAALIGNDGRYIQHHRGELSDELAVLQYTGGTTGVPKGAMLTHANLMAAVRAYEARGWGGDPLTGSDLKRLIVLPLCHIIGLVCAVLVPVAAGAELVVHLRFDPGRVLSDIARKRVRIFSGVPSMYAMLVQHSRTEQYDLSSLRYWVCGGAPLPVEVLESFRALTGITPRDGYGLTETATAGASHPMASEPRPGSVGLPLPGITLEVVDLQTGMATLPPGSLGEICLTGPAVMKGYWKQPDETATAFRGGRFHTGDIGVVDEDGYVTLLDRKKDLILSGGYNVFPRNVEEVIYQHPAVAEVIVIGIPNTIMGQLVKAYIALKPGEAGLDRRGLDRFLSGKLASYELPSEIEVLPSLPKTAVGKPSRTALAAMQTGSPAG